MVISEAGGSQPLDLQLVCPVIPTLDLKARGCRLTNLGCCGNWLPWMSAARGTPQYHLALHCGGGGVAWWAPEPHRACLGLESRRGLPILEHEHQKGTLAGSGNSACGMASMASDDTGYHGHSSDEGNQVDLVQREVHQDWEEDRRDREHGHLAYEAAIPPGQREKIWTTRKVSCHRDRMVSLSHWDRPNPNPHLTESPVTSGHTTSSCIIGSCSSLGLFLTRFASSPSPWLSSVREVSRFVVSYPGYH